MDKEDIQHAVEKVVRDVFENMYFMFPEVAQDDDQAALPPERCFKARVGVKNGSEVFVFYGSEQLVSRMAKNLLGTDQASKASDLVDVFKEAANVIAGNLVTTTGVDRSVGLEIPVAERLQVCSEPEEPQGAIFNIDGEFFRLAVMN